LRLSLFWRTFALISLLLAISLGAWYQLYRAFEQPPQASRFAWEMASAINLARTALVHTRGSDREALLQAMASNQGLRVYPRSDADRVEPYPNQKLGVEVERQLTKRLGNPTTLAGRVNGVHALWVSFDIDDERYWLIAEPERLVLPMTGSRTEMVAFAIGVLLAMIGGLLISRLVNRPPANLARSLDRLPRGEPPPPPTPLARPGHTGLLALRH